MNVKQDMIYNDLRKEEEAARKRREEDERKEGGTVETNRASTQTQVMSLL